MALSFSVKAATASKTPPNIIIINSYHQGYNWSDQEISGLLSRLREEYPQLDPPIEHLDAKRFPGTDQMQRMKYYLAQKYFGRKIDLLIVLDNPALDLVLKYRQDLFPQVPIVFAGINNFYPNMLANQKKITGVAEIQDSFGSLKTALALHPKTENVLIVHDYTSSGLAVRRELEQELPKLSKKLNIMFTPPSTFQEVLDQIKALPANSVGLILTFTTDSQGQSYPLAESTKILTSGPIPIYAAHETRLGHGIVGGNLIGGKMHGSRAGDLALQVLHGENPDRIPVDTSRTSKVMFDYDQLARFKIPLGALPNGSVVINRPISLYEQHRQLVWIVSTIFVILCSLVVALIIYIVLTRRIDKIVRESEERHRVLIQTAMDGVWWLDLQGNLVQVNDAYCRMSGYSEAELLAMKGWELEGIESKEQFNKNIQHVISTGHIRFESKHHRQDGTLYDIEASVQYLSTAGGRIVAFVRDISDRKQAENSLRASEERYRLITDNTLDSIWAMGPDFHFTYISPSTESLFGYTRGEWDTLEWSVFVHPNHLDNVIKVFDGLRQDPKNGSVTETVLVLHKDGREMWVEFTASPIMGLMGQLIGVVGVTRDITQRKQMETKLQENQRILANAERLAGLGGWKYDMINDVWIMSDNWLRIHGVSNHQLTTVELMPITYPEDVPIIQAALNQSIQHGEPYQIEHRIVRQDTGEVRYIQGYGEIIKDESGKPLAMFGAALDITERKRAEEKILASLKEKEVLLKEVHHRVKNNMQIISTLLDLQLEHVKDQSPAEIFRDCQNRIRSMSLVHESLYQSENLASIEFRQYLEDLTNRLLGLYARGPKPIEAKVNGQDIEVDLYRAIPLGLVANELVLNSLKHAFPGDQSGEIQVITAKKGKHRVIEFKDNGVGLGQEINLDDPQTFGWLLISNLVKQIDGTIEVSSNGGTTCRIEF